MPKLVKVRIIVEDEWELADTSEEDTKKEIEDMCSDIRNGFLCSARVDSIIFSNEQD